MIIPGHDIHVFVDRTLFGKAYWRIHREMDWPYGFFGRRHRVLFHDPLTAIAIARSCYPGDENAVLAALAHIEIDNLCSANPFFKRQLKLFAKAAKKKRKRTKKSTRKKQQLFPPEWERFLKDLEKMVKIRRMMGLS